MSPAPTLNAALRPEFTVTTDALILANNRASRIFFAPDRVPSGYSFGGARCSRPSFFADFTYPASLVTFPTRERRHAHS